MWAVHDLTTWQELMAPRAFARLDAIERVRRGEGPAYLITHPDPSTPTQEAIVPAEDINTRAWQIYGQHQLVPPQATFALSTTARRRRSSAWRFRQMM
ncbi:hypothetical protein NKH18_49095 [Streptomyces sp. M10(2022)]